MNIKKLKTKHIMALALALFMVMPMLFAASAVPGAKAQGSPYMSIVPTGQPGATSTTNFAAQGIGTTLVVDVRADNLGDLPQGGATGITYMVTWDPTVLSLQSYVNNAWLPASGNSATQLSIDSPTNAQASTADGQLIVNQINNGGYQPTTVSGAVSVTITFNVIGSGSTAINLENSPGYTVYLTAPNAGQTASVNVAGVLTYGALYNPTTTISLYTNPADNSNTYSFPAGTDTIGQTFQVDVYLNNPLGLNIWGWNLGVTWNAAAVQLTGFTEGSYFNPVNSGTPTENTLFLPGTADNNLGQDIAQGMSDVYLSDVTTNAPSGVLATLTFTVISFNSATITLSQGTTSLGTLTTITGNTPSKLTNPLTLNNFNYVTVSPPTPTSPVAKITNTGTSTTYTPGQVLSPAFNSGTAFALTAANSVPGTDDIPNSADASYPSYPVTGYSWTYTAPSGAPTLFTSPTTTETLSFNTPTVNSLTTYTVSLTVTTAANPNDANYINTGTVTFSFQVQPASTPPTTAGALLDIYVVNPGTPVYNPSTASTTNPNYSPDGNNGNPLAYGTAAYTPNAYSDAFGPQAQMILAGLATYNGAPVANKEVTFVIYSNQAVAVATLTATTDENGIATVSYRLPWYDGSYATGPASEFGIWIVKGAVEVQQTIVTDNMPFDFGNIINFVSGSLTPASTSLPRSTLTITTTQSFTVSLKGISDQTQNYWMSFTVIDAGNVPVATGVVSGTMPAAAYSETSAGVLTVTPSTASTGASFTIPSYAFVGTATIVVNLYNANPVTSLSSAVSYCPQASGTFTIAIPFGQ